MGFILFLILNSLVAQNKTKSNKFKQPIISTYPPNSIILKNLSKIVEQAPSASIHSTNGFSRYSSIFSSTPFWFTDEGNIYFFKYFGYKKYKLTSLFHGKSSHIFSNIKPVSNQTVGVLPDGTVVVVKKSTFYYYSPDGHFIKSIPLPISSNILGFHSIGSNQLIVWGQKILLLVKKSGKIKWKQTLDANLSYIRTYGVSNYFLMELKNRVLELRSWETGKKLWGKNAKSTVSSWSMYGFMTGGNILFSRDYKNIKIIKPKTGKIITSYKFPWKVINIYFSSISKGFFVKMQGYRLGYFDLKTGTFKWIVELGSPIIAKYFFMKGDFVITWKNRLLAFSVSGKLKWTAVLPFSGTKFKSFRIPGGNMGIATKNKVYILYPPSII